MKQLLRITTQYVDVQDRIRLSGEVQAGDALVVWLTHRLLNRLLPGLLGWLENQSGGGAVNAMLPGYHTDAVQGFAQQAARAQLAKQPPVQAEGASPHWLLVSVDLTHTAQSVALVFKGEDAHARVGLTLTTQPLRQWVNIVHDQYLQAGWSMEVWPAWITESAVQPVQGPTLMH